MEDATGLLINTIMSVVSETPDREGNRHGKDTQHATNGQTRDGVQIEKEEVKEGKREGREKDL